MTYRQCSRTRVPKSVPLIDEKSQEETIALLEVARQNLCVSGKTGGPYSRSTFLRGEEHAVVGSRRGAAESAKIVLDVTCPVPTIRVKRHAVALTAAQWEIPDCAPEEHPVCAQLERSHDGKKTSVLRR